MVDHLDIHNQPPIADSNETMRPHRFFYITMKKYKCKAMFGVFFCYILVTYCTDLTTTKKGAGYARLKDRNPGMRATHGIVAEDDHGIVAEDDTAELDNIINPVVKGSIKDAFMRDDTNLLNHHLNHYNVQDWQTVSEQSVYSYSAYFDYRYNRVVLPSVVDGRKVTRRRICRFWYRGGEPAEVKSVLKMLLETHGLRYRTCLLTCPLDGLEPPDYVSLFEVTDADHDNEHRINPGNMFHVQMSPTLSHNIKFTVCVSPLHSNFSNANKLVEFIELNRIFGAEHFIFYNFSSVKNELDPYLKYYRSEGLISVENWSLPDTLVRDMQYFGQVTAFNDCLYRTMDRSLYTLFLDLDEFIVPFIAPSWEEMLQDPEVFPPGKSKDSTASFVFQFTNMRTDLPDDSKFMMDPFISKYEIISLLKMQRSRKLFLPKMFSKAMVIPNKVVSVGVNSVYEFVDKHISSVNFPSRKAMLFHYGSNKIMETSNIAENRMLKFSGKIIKNIKSVHKSVKGLL